MKIIKIVLAVNGVTLALNGVIVWLTVVKTFPAILGIFLVLVFLAGAVWLSCYVNGKLPRRTPKRTLYSAPTQKVERV